MGKKSKFTNIKCILALFIFLLLLPTVQAKASLVYAVTLTYDGSTLLSKGIRLIEGDAPTRLNQPKNGFMLRVVSIRGQVLHSFKFLIETTPIRDPLPNIFDENGTQVVIPEAEISLPKETSVILVAPYFKNAKSIEIFDENDKLLLSVDVSKYTKRSNDVWGHIVIIVVVVLSMALYKRLTKKKPQLNAA